MATPRTLVNAVATLWQAPSVANGTLSKTPAFRGLVDVCRDEYGVKNADYALAVAIRSLGAPSGLPSNRRGLALDPGIAAACLHDNLSRTTSKRRYLCPLDMADDLPTISFGNNRVEQFSPETLGYLFDLPRLNRYFPGVEIPVQDFSQFRWLAVDEEVEVDPRPEARALPVLFTDLSRDFGEVEPHLGQFPSAVEAALFFLLLAPWEDWVTSQEVNWRGFRVPWVHTVDDDLFVRPSLPPRLGTLTLQPDIYVDHDGNEFESERPAIYSLEDRARTVFSGFDDSAWQTFMEARTTSAFETPICHFIVKAFLADGIDEVMAHMTAIEAGVGLEMDHKRRLRSKPDPFPSISPSDRVAARLAALLSDAESANSYRTLFDLRSSFVHGRAGMSKIPTTLRVEARSLARRMAQELVRSSARFGGDRLEVLAQLLAVGARFVAKSE